MKSALIPALLAASTLAAPAMATPVDDFLGLPMASETDPAKLKARCDVVMAEAEKRLAALEKGKEKPTVDKTLRAFDDLVNLIASSGNDFSLYENVFLTEEQRNEGSECLKRISALDTRLKLSRPIYDKLKAIDARHAYI